jgi:hypothetical protein
LKGGKEARELVRGRMGAVERAGERVCQSAGRLREHVSERAREYMSERGRGSEESTQRENGSKRARGCVSERGRGERESYAEGGWERAS